MFQDLLTRNKDVKRRRCKANIHNKLCYNFTKITINEYPLQSERSPFSECVNQPSPQPSSIGEGEEKNNPFSLWEREQLCEQVEHTTAGEGANRCQDVQKSGVQSDVHKILKQVQDDINISLKRTYSHINLFTYSPYKKAAFTLAEVLITLGIIGVVAAMTIPVLIGNYRKNATVAKLQKFYSVMNQAIKLAEVDNGEPSMWMPQRENDSNADFGKWYNTYLDKHIKSLSKNYYGYYYHVAFADGSGFAAYIPALSQLTGKASAYIFYCIDYKYCSINNSYDGKHTFLFAICSDGRFAASGCDITTDNYYTRDVLLSGCASQEPHLRHYCTALIQYDGWQISKDYPWIK